MNKVAIIPLGKESREVSQVLANETSRRVLDLIADEPLSAMRIAYKLNMAINTAQYNLERLESVGLVEVARVEKSRRGRDVKIYAPTNKIIAIVPKNAETAGLLEIFRGIMPLVFIATVFAIGIDFLAYPSAPAQAEPTMYEAPAASEILGAVPPPAGKAPEPTAMKALEGPAAGGTAPEGTEGAINADASETYQDRMTSDGETRTARGPDMEETIIVGEKHPGLWFFAGSLVTIAAVLALRGRHWLRFGQ